jgi:hypothetical protein
VAYKVIKPDNTVLLTGSIDMSGYPSTTVHLPKLLASGTYSLVLSPGTATLNTNVRLEADPALVVDGAAVVTSQDFAAQSTRFIFNATANQRIGIGLLGVAFTPPYSAGVMYLGIYNPDGSGLASTSCNGPNTNNTASNCDYEIVAPAAAGFVFESTARLASTRRPPCGSPATRPGH